DAERTESDVGTRDVERIRLKWHCCQRRIEKRSRNLEIAEHRQVFVAQIAHEGPIVHLAICRRQRRRESRKVKLKISPIQRVRVTKEPDVEPRWVHIEPRSRGTRRRMRKRRVHTRLRKPATTKKHSRPQGEISTWPGTFKLPESNPPNRMKLPLEERSRSRLKIPPVRSQKSATTTISVLSSPVPALIQASHSPISLDAPMFEFP